MTSREFIQKQFGNADGQTRSLSSIVKDGEGNIYSYGSHYPLLFKAGGLVFRNTRGYSSTTGKHIGWCYDFNSLDVELSGCNQYSWRNSENANKVPALLYSRVSGWGKKASDHRILKAVLKDLETQRDRLQAELDSKKRQNTQVYRSLTRDLGDVLTTINKVEGVL